MPWGRLNTGGSATGGGDAVEGAVISQVPALQLERQNFIIASGDFTNAAWTTTGVLTVTGNTTAAPNGATQADTLDDADAAALATIQQAVTIPNDANPYVASCYFTLGTSAQARLQLALTGGVAVTTSVDFNPANGAQIAASGAGNVQISSVSINGVTWIRVEVTATNNASGNVTATLTVAPASAAVASTGTVIAWGAQIEQAVSATSGASDLIQTDTASVTRRAGRMPPYLLDHSFGPVRQVTTNFLADPAIHNGALILAASTLTVTLPSFTSAGTGWPITVKNVATGTVTIQGTTATELVRVPGGLLNGNTNITLPFSATTGAGPYNVAGAMLAAGSTGLWEIVQTLETHGELMVTTNGSTFVVPAGVNTIWVDGAAAGGGGGAAANGSTTGGGGASGGACAVGMLLRVVPGAAHNMAIGVAGQGGSAGANNGTNGGSTALGAILTLPGGNFGSGAAAGNFGNGGSSVGFGSGRGGRCTLINPANLFNGPGGGTVWAPTSFNIQGGSVNGSTAVGFGAGGEGAVDNGTAARAGGGGADGFLRIRW